MARSSSFSSSSDFDSLSDHEQLESESSSDPSDEDSSGDDNSAEESSDEIEETKQIRFPAETSEAAHKKALELDPFLWKEKIRGGVRYYHCRYLRNKHYHPCRLRAHLRMSIGNQAVFTVVGRHRHRSHANTKLSITKEVKEIVRNQIQINQKVTPKDLRKHLYDLGHGKYEIDQIRQLKSREKRAIAREKLVEAGVEDIDLAVSEMGSKELEAWCAARMKDENDKPFVIYYSIEEAVAPRFAIVMSSGPLLKKLSEAQCLNVDGTHKVVEKKFKVSKTS